jgi:hypothetical protein
MWQRGSSKGELSLFEAPFPFVVNPLIFPGEIFVGETFPFISALEVGNKNEIKTRHEEDFSHETSRPNNLESPAQIDLAWRAVPDKPKSFQTRKRQGHV